MVFDDYDLCENCETKSEPTVKNALKVMPPAPAGYSSAIYDDDDEDVEPEMPEIHNGITCDGCSMFPIVGTRCFETRQSIFGSICLTLYAEREPRES